MKWLGPAAFALGAVGLGALVYYAGLASVGKALAALGFGGLAIVAVLHLPVIALLGLAWWVVGHDVAGAVPWKFIWARFVRESAAEVLPFSQVGGFVIGARALSLMGLRALSVAVTMLVDLVVELSAKLPYVLVGLVLLMIANPGSSLVRPLALSLVVTIAALGAVIAFRRRIRSGLEAAAMSLGKRWPGLGLGAQADMKPLFDRVVEHDWRVLGGFAIHMLSWAFGAIETWVMFQLMGVNVTASEAVVIDSLFAGFRTFAFAVPAAVGIQEAGYVLICGLYGITPAAAIAFSLARRAREFATGVPGLGAWQAVEGRRAFARWGANGGASQP